MAGWTMTDAQKVSRDLQKVLDFVVKKNDEHDKHKHAFKGRDLSQHESAKAAVAGLFGVKGTFDSIAYTKKRSK